MSEKLKPCPFCGYDLNRDPHICCFVNETRQIIPDNVQVHCTGCGARGGSAWNETEAILKWNRRTPCKTIDETKHARHEQKRSGE